MAAQYSNIKLLRSEKGGGFHLWGPPSLFTYIFELHDIRFADKFVQNAGFVANDLDFLWVKRSFVDNFQGTDLSFRTRFSFAEFY